MQNSRKWTIYLIHHSHLDVGYTHTASEIAARYNRFLDDILCEVDKIKAGKAETKGYKYTVECFWILDRYAKAASPEKLEKLYTAIREGYIEVTGSYFNFTDSLHPRLYGALVRRAQRFAAGAGVKVRSAMFSDVNGLNSAYAEQLAENGVEYLFTNVHSGHGLYALNEKLVPFRWELPNGRRLLCYSGELYTYGNEFGFCPRGAFSDVMSDEGYDAKSYNYDAKMDRWMDIPEKRFAELLGHLESTGHPYPFVAMGLHGTDDDNAIPNPGIVSRIREWNGKHGDTIEVKLVTVSEFFDAIKDTEGIPTYAGDWPDWWNDGIGSAPQHFKYFKRVQNEYLYYRDAAPELTEQSDEEIETTAALFAEHTFGHFLSVEDPYLDRCGSIQLVKQGYIGRLIGLVEDIKYKYLNANGVNDCTVNVSNRFRLINPVDLQQSGVVPLRFDKFDLYTYPAPYRITDEGGTVYPYFMKELPELRAAVPHVSVELGPKQQMTLTVESTSTSEYELKLFESAFHKNAGVGFDRIPDIHPASIPKSKFLFDHVLLSETAAELPGIRICWNKRGVYSIFDKTAGTELLNSREFLGAPVLEICKSPAGDVQSDREANRRYQTISRNKKTLTTDRYFGELDMVDLLEDTPYYFELAFYFKLTGFDTYIQVLRVYKSSKKIEMTIRLTKEYIAKAHNLYIGLPFADRRSRVFLDRGDILTEAWKDQLPGTLTDYNTVYGGFLVERGDTNIAVASPDVYLLQLKSYEYEPAVLMCDRLKELREFSLFSWPISTVWHVNFFARESNHLSLAYTIEWGDKITRENAIGHFKHASLGIIQYKV